MIFDGVVVDEGFVVVSVGIGVYVVDYGIKELFIVCLVLVICRLGIL